MHGRISVWTMIAGVCLGTLLGGCGDSSGTGGAASTSEVAAAESSAASASASPASGRKAAYADAEACAWLKENLPKWADITSEVGVQAQITIGLSSFFEEHGGLKNADGAAFDDATTRGCRAEHDKAVKKAGIASFGQL